MTLAAGFTGGWLANAYLIPASTSTTTDTGTDPNPSVPPGDTTLGNGLPGLGLLPKLSKPLNVLLMATDVNFTVKDGKKVMGLNGNTDTMIVIRFDPTTEQIRMLSIPRDTRVPIPGHGTFKINSANPYGGRDLAKQVVSEFLDGVVIDKY
jgi:anionic cell wall polymer biosynthesis LytR-Cps2A-Psr (LCP) family protein